MVITKPYCSYFANLEKPSTSLPLSAHKLTPINTTWEQPKACVRQQVHSVDRVQVSFWAVCTRLLLECAMWGFCGYSNYNSDFFKNWHFPDRLGGYRTWTCHWRPLNEKFVNTLRTGDADLRFYITTVQDEWGKSAFLTRACFPCTIHLIMQYIEPVPEWSCWRIFIETWPHSELTFRHRASSVYGQAFRYSPENAFYINNQQIYFIIWYLLDHASLI